MILSNLHGSDTGANYPAAIQRALAWLRKTDVLALEAGRVEIEPEGKMYALVQDLTTHAMEDSKLEAHKAYLDLMYWPEAGERIGVAHLTGREPVKGEKPEKDVRYFASVEGENILQTAPGDYCVLFPWDIHRPGLDPEGGRATFRKIVMKIAVDQL